MRLTFFRRPPTGPVASPVVGPEVVPAVAPLATGHATPPDPVMVYGADWCADCHTVTRYLDRRGVPYRWVDLGADAAAQERIAAAGYRAIPVVVLPDGRTLVEPSARQLGEALDIA